jgi:hypothetical protein
MPLFLQDRQTTDPVPYVTPVLRGLVLQTSVKIYVVEAKADPDLDFFPIPDLRAKKAPDPDLQHYVIALRTAGGTLDSPSVCIISRMMRIRDLYAVFLSSRPRSGFLSLL